MSQSTHQALFSTGTENSLRAPWAAEHQATTFVRAIGLLSFFIAIVLSLAVKPAIASEACLPNAPAPNTTASPQEVVKTVIDALRDNDKANTGIATVFCFASPSNKSVTGPLERFTAMITNGYGVMLNHAYNYVEDMKIEDDTAMQVVWLVAADGKEYGYLFTMGKQQAGEFADMWMTEAVVPIERKGTQGLGI